MHSTGLLIPSYPYILGFDFSGLVLSIGEAVPKDLFIAGKTRVAGYAATVWKRQEGEGKGLDYGAFQEVLCVPWQMVVRLPEGEGNIGWNEAATLGVGFQVPLSAWDAMGILRGGGKSRGEKAEALLVWGASSSVGTGGVQSARVLKEEGGERFGAVYAVAGKANHEYVRSLGADRVFDYEEAGAVDAVIQAAKEDGLVIRHCFLAMGDVGLCQDVLKTFGGEGKIASAPPIPEDVANVDGVEVMFVQPNMVAEGERLKQFEYWFGTWLRENLEKGNVVPSPPVQVIGRGLESVDAGIEAMGRGVSCKKLVIELEE